MTKIDLGQFYPIGTAALPDSWTVAYVGDFALRVQSGFACGKHGRDDGVPHLRPMNVSREGALDLSDLKTVPPTFNDKRLRQGDVLFNNTNSPELVGKTALVTQRGNLLAFSNHMTQVQLGEGITPKFFALQLHYLWAQKYFFHRCVKHVNQASISATELAKKIPFVCPPTNEQRRIVEKIEALFDQIDKAVESLQTARTTLGRYRQSLLKSAFEGRLTADWRAQNANKLEGPGVLLTRIQRERDTCYKAALDAWQEALDQWRAGGEKGNKPAKPKRPKDLEFEAHDRLTVPNGWITAPLAGIALESVLGKMLDRQKNRGKPRRYLGNINLRWGAFDVDREKTIPIEDHEVPRYGLRAGDLVVCEGGEPGRCAVWQGDDNIVFIQKALHRVRFTQSYNEWFAYYFLKFATSTGLLNKHYTGSTIKHLTGKALAEVLLPICSPAEQDEVVNILDAELEAADALEAEIDAALTRADALRQSTLKKAFAGHLVPQDHDDEPASALLDRIKAEKAEKEKAAKRDGKSAPARKPKARRPTLNDLMEVLEKQKGWISAAKAARELGIGDESTSDDVEAFYRQLKGFVEDGAIEVKRRGDEDWLRMAKAQVS